ncbi:MAG: hypothetical protein EOM91_07050 [Sphingobacteriia bacterium]|nr:hypothetical protein [Sphingobacteriia bacterium]NCC38899.1 hypothetical protein [Gammaproteobacteria bacterium]
MRIRRLSAGIAILATLSMITGCQTLVRESIPGDWVEIPPGSHLRLEQAVLIPAGRARGVIGDRRAADGTSCVIEVRRLDHEATQRVAPGRYRIMRVQDDMALVSGPVWPPGHGPVRFQLAGHGDSGGSQMVRFGYHFWLDDGQDPNLMRLTCLGRLDDPAATRPPTLREIQAVLGEQARIERAAPSAEDGAAPGRASAR